MKHHVVLVTRVIKGKLVTRVIKGKLVTRVIKGKLVTRVIKGKLVTRVIKGKLVTRVIKGKLVTRVIKGKFVPVRVIKAYGEVEVQHLLLLTATLYGGNLPASHYSRFNPGQRVPCACQIGWEGSITGLDAFACVEIVKCIKALGRKK
jgi:hypothetical protein